MQALGLRIGIVAACITDADARPIFLKSQSFKLFKITAYYVTSTLLTRVLLHNGIALC